MVQARESPTSPKIVLTIFGGSLYGCVDPLYMVILIKNLGADCTVWDKSATIRFKKPGKTTLFAHFQIDRQELDTIRDMLETTRSIGRLYTVELKDAAGVVHAIVEKTIYIRRNTPLIGTPTLMQAVSGTLSH